MFANLYDYISMYADFDFWGGFVLTDIAVFLISFVLTCIVAFLPIAFIIKIVRRVS